MRNVTASTEGGREYAAAYVAHDAGRDLPAALQLYMTLIASHPDTQEAGYSRAQVHDIVNSVVPKQELLDAEIGLARAHLEHGDQSDARRNPVRPLAPELSP